MAGGPFTKGDVRINRRGRPRKGMALTDVLSFKLDQKDASGKLRREAIAEKLIALAESGDVTALRYVFDRIDGKPRQSMEIAAVDPSDLRDQLRGVLE